MKVLVIISVLILLLCSRVIAERSNLVVILTDDQDTLLGGFDPSTMPKLHKLLRIEGRQFSHGFANSPVCCPSRSTILTGRYTHNHGARNNSLPGGCASRDWQKTSEADATVVHLAKAGYNSLYAGKYLNNYGFPTVGGVKYIPPGWTEWYALVGNSRYYNYTVSNNGVAETHGDNYEADYFTDVLKRRAVKFIKEQGLEKKKRRGGEMGSDKDGRPFFLMVGTPSAHASFTPAPQYEPSLDDQSEAPRTPSFNNIEANIGKHKLLRDLPPMDDSIISQTDEIFRKRHSTLRSVDDLVEEVVNALISINELENTYIFFTSDHGFHLGQFGMSFDKRQLYESDINVPYLVRGPGIGRNSTSKRSITHVDLGPTLLELAGVDVPASMDGESFKNALFTETQTHELSSTITEEEEETYSKFIQYFGESKKVERCGSNNETYTTSNDSQFFNQYVASVCDHWNNTYSCIRTNNNVGTVDNMFCIFNCYDDNHNLIPCASTHDDHHSVVGSQGGSAQLPEDIAERLGEYYDLTKDPWQLNNKITELASEVIEDITTEIRRLQKCAGQECLINCPACAKI
eukprot:g2367.t1